MDSSEKTTTIKVTAKPPVGEVELTLTYLFGLISEYRAQIFYSLLGLLIIWIFSQTKEVTTWLVLSYFLALLLDPVIEKLGKIGIKRPLAVIVIFLLAVFLIVGFGAVVAPLLFDGYEALISNFPDYLRSASKRGIQFLSRFKIHVPRSPDELVASVTGHIDAVKGEHVKRIWAALSTTLLSGYSLTMAIVNFILFPFFFFYICVDLRKFHAYVGRLMSHNVRQTIREIGGEIVGDVRTFFRGQFLVASILTILYIVGLLAVGLPYALVVGMITGVLSLIPYLGVFVGVTTGLIITLSTDPSWIDIAKVLGVFAIINAFENNVLAPRILGGQLGIHPLGVMVAVLVGGQLMGLMGLILALPIVAAVRVLLARAVRELEENQVSEGSETPTIITTSY